MASKKTVNRPSIRNPNHNHSLRVFKAQNEDEIICSGCALDLTGQAFKCTKECDYFLDKSCFELAREINHMSHPDHPITLLFSPHYDHQSYACNYNVHVGCAFIPETVEREDHEHPLTLLYKIPCKDGKMYVCDVCKEQVSENLWTYHCKECDYGTHLHSCSVDEDYDEEEEEEEKKNREGARGASRMKSLMKAQEEMAAMKLDSRMKNAANNAIIYSIR